MYVVVLPLESSLCTADLLKRNAHSFKSLLLSLAPVKITDLSSRPTFSLTIDEKELTIYLVAPEDGKAFLANTASIFAEAVQNKMLKLEDIEVPLLNEKLECACCPLCIDID